MRLLDRQAQLVKHFEGQLSDGSDRVEVTSTEVVLRVLDNLNRLQVLTFDHDPTDPEILAALPDPPELAPSTKADFERGPLQARYEAWQRWKATRAEAQARSVAAAVITALQAREDSAWTAYLVSLQAWRAAT